MLVNEEKVIDLRRSPHRQNPSRASLSKLSNLLQSSKSPPAPVQLKPKISPLQMHKIPASFDSPPRSSRQSPEKAKERRKSSSRLDLRPQSARTLKEGPPEPIPQGKASNSKDIRIHLRSLLALIRTQRLSQSTCDALKGLFGLLAGLHHSIPFDRIRLESESVTSFLRIMKENINYFFDLLGKIPMFIREERIVQWQIEFAAELLIRVKESKDIIDIDTRAILIYLKDIINLYRQNLNKHTVAGAGKARDLSEITAEISFDLTDSFSSIKVIETDHYADCTPTDVEQNFKSPVNVAPVRRESQEALDKPAEDPFAQFVANRVKRMISQSQAASTPSKTPPKYLKSSQIPSKSAKKAETPALLLHERKQNHQIRVSPQRKKEPPAQLTTREKAEALLSRNENHRGDADQKLKALFQEKHKLKVREGHCSKIASRFPGIM